jgi:hypothetical protein
MVEEDPKDRAEEPAFGGLDESPDKSLDELMAEKVALTEELRVKRAEKEARGRPAQNIEELGPPLKTLGGGGEGGKGSAG